MMKFTQVVVSSVLFTGFLMAGLSASAQQVVLQADAMTGSILPCDSSLDRAINTGREAVSMKVVGVDNSNASKPTVQVQLNMSVCTLNGLQPATSPAQSVFPSATEAGVTVTLKYDHFQLDVTTAQNQVVYHSQDLTTLQQTGQQIVSIPANQLPLRLVLGSDNTMLANGIEVPTGSSDFGSFLLNLVTVTK